MRSKYLFSKKFEEAVLKYSATAALDAGAIYYLTHGFANSNQEEIMIGSILAVVSIPLNAAGYFEIKNKFKK